ncbi:MAG: DUF3990 domain-containing protein [Oscillospiraceae bacterium]|jgi:hypothetical protein|nr:DUF3990 domain-containing protein [Oscillospiraceae bacterium]
MQLCHGSDVIVEKPILMPEQRALDFGNGFYTTTNSNQAEVFARKVGDRRETEKCYVSFYNVADFEVLKRELSVLEFSEPSGEWLDFVFENRADQYRGTAYDIIFGPVANDTIYRVFTAYENGVIGKEECIRQLRVRKLYNQMTFASEKALSYLTYTGHIELLVKGGRSDGR